MDKAQVLEALSSLAAREGRRIGVRAFAQETGITQRWLRYQVWFTSWNGLLQELGLPTRSFSVPKIPADNIANAVAALSIRLGRWPTEDDLTRERAVNKGFPSPSTIQPLRRSGELAKLIVALGTADPDLGEAARIASTKVVTAVPTDRESLQERVTGYVYMLKSGRRYKIGKTNNVARRYKEVRLELPEETSRVHAIETDDPSGIETYWHQRFAQKRVRGTEFFELDAADIRAFKRRKYQ